MKLSRLLGIFVLAACGLLGCNDDDKENTDVSCNGDGDCGDKICVNHQCIPRCTPTTCGEGMECGANGRCAQKVDLLACSATKPCLDSSTYYCDTDAGKCVKRCPTAACPSDKRCDTGSGRCVERCTENSCTGGKICDDFSGVCVDGCVKTGCTGGKICDEQTGKCGPGCNETGCAGRKVCNAANGLCMPHCLDVNCADGLLCNTQSGQCQAHCSAETCTGDTVCDPVGGKCVSDCRKSGAVCANGGTCGEDGVCFDKCHDASCKTGEFCSAAGACETKCTKGSCGTGKVCTESGACMTLECSSLEPCADGRFCQNGKCHSVDTMTCYADEDCGAGYGCDKNKCVDAKSCSLTRPCADEKICRDGQCIDKPAVACSDKVACSDGKTCIAGQCVTCNCGEGKTCVGDNQCVDSNKAGTYTVGASCTWTKDFAHCVDNREVMCINDKIEIKDCGAKVCSFLKEDEELMVDAGAKCREPCSAKDDFYGVCVAVSYETELYAFTHQCLRDELGHDVWELAHGVTACSVGEAEFGCTNGRCNYVPDEVRAKPPISCTPATFPDTCRGDWLMYCYGSYQMGEACSLKSKSHKCSIPGNEAFQRNAQLEAACALPCDAAGAVSRGCIQDGNGNVFSMNYLCAETTAGDLRNFPAGYVQCEFGCSNSTGECLEFAPDK